MNHAKGCEFLTLPQGNCTCSLFDGHQFDDAYAVSPAAMSDEQIALRDAMTVTAVDQAESVAAIAASLHSLLDGLCKSVERLERERDEMRTVLVDLKDQCKQNPRLFEHRGQIIGTVHVDMALVDRAEQLLAGG